MKKLFWIIVAILVFLFIVGSMNDSNSGESTNNSANGDSNVNVEIKNWKIYAELDEFKNETGNKYIKNIKAFKGTFTNSATTDEDAYFYIGYDGNELYIVVRQYRDDASNENISVTNEKYKIVVLDSSGERHELYGFCKSGERNIVLEDNTLMEFIMNNDEVKIYGERVGTTLPRTFLFTVEKDNFSDVYNEYTGNAEQ